MDKQSAWRPQSQPVELATLHKDLARHSLVVVHFWARWNLHDRKMDEILEGLRARWAGRVEFRSFDVDIIDEYDFCRDCRVSNVPALAALNRGVWLQTVIGLRPPGELEDRLREWTSEAESPHLMWDQAVDASM